MANKEIKSRPAGINDSFDVTYTNFASDRASLRTGPGKDFDNTELLKTLGFREGPDGTMSISATSNEIQRDAKGKVSKRTMNGRVLTESKEAGMDR